MNQTEALNEGRPERGKYIERKKNRRSTLNDNLETIQGKGRNNNIAKKYRGESYSNKTLRELGVKYVLVFFYSLILDVITTDRTTRVTK